MNSFEKKLTRLKKLANLHTDKSVCELLGMSQRAFASRKIRGSFPDDRLFATVARNPELDLDVQYILTGTPTTRGQLKAEGKLRTSDGFINARDKFIEEDDGDTSRDNEIFTTKMTYQLSEDEWELIQMFRQLSLIDKMQVVQLANNSTNKTNSNVSISIIGDGNRTAGRNFNEDK